MFKLEKIVEVDIFVCRENLNELLEYFPIFIDAQNENFQIYKLNQREIETLIIAGIYEKGKCFK